MAFDPNRDLFYTANIGRTDHGIHMSTG